MTILIYFVFVAFRHYSFSEEHTCLLNSQLILWQKHFFHGETSYSFYAIVGITVVCHFNKFNILLILHLGSYSVSQPGVSHKRLIKFWKKMEPKVWELVSIFFATFLALIYFPNFPRNQSTSQTKRCEKISQEFLRPVKEKELLLRPLNCLWPISTINWIKFKKIYFSFVMGKATFCLENFIKIWPIILEGEALTFSSFPVRSNKDCIMKGAMQG